MADLVMTVNKATAHRHGHQVVVSVSGESANSRDQVFTEASQHGATADVYVRVRPAVGFGTQITGSFSTEASLHGADEVKTVRVHARSGIKTITVD